MKNIKKTTKLVKAILTKYPETRGDNDILYLKVCEIKNPHLLGLPFSVVMMHRDECGFPPFESVVRARRKVQRAYPELAADETVEAYREELDERYKNYAREVVV